MKWELLQLRAQGRFVRHVCIRAHVCDVCCRSGTSGMMSFWQRPAAQMLRPTARTLQLVCASHILSRA